MTYETKRAAIAAAIAVGIPIHHRLTKAQIEARLDAWEEAGHDTGEAIYADANDLHPVAPGNTPATAMHIPPGNVLLIGGAIGVAAHLAHLL
jgi:hypothetical protein